MSESTNKPVGDRRAVAHSRGIRGNTTNAEQHQAQAAIIESGVLEKIEALKQTALCDVEPLLIDGAGI
jgi:hypothetical protein